MCHAENSGEEKAMEEKIGYTSTYYHFRGNHDVLAIWI